jgi:hypothetical protein
MWNVTTISGVFVLVAGWSLTSNAADFSHLSEEPPVARYRAAEPLPSIDTSKKHDYPTGFYRENLAENESVNHLKLGHDLCASSPGSAWNLVQKFEGVTESRTAYAGWSENDLFYDFKMARGNFVQHDRLYKCNVAVPGFIQKKNFSAAEVTKFLDYLEYKDSYNIAGRKVVSRLVTDKGAFFEYRTVVQSTTFGDFGLKDNVTAVEKIFSVDKQTGSILEIK